MAIKINNDNFWINLVQFGDVPELKQLITFFLEQGGTLVTEFYTVKASIMGYDATIKDFVTSTSSIAKNQSSKQKTHLVAVEIFKGLLELLKTVGLPINFKKNIAGASLNQGVPQDAKPLNTSEIPIKPSSGLKHVFAAIQEATQTDTAQETPPFLMDAIKIGQIVRGSYKKSRYRVIALGPVNIAARHKNEVLSIRAELCNITEVQQYAPILIKAGFSAGNAKTTDTIYYSMHLKSDGCPESRILGSLLFGLNIKFKEVVSPSMVNIINEGIA